MKCLFLLKKPKSGGESCFVFLGGVFRGTLDGHGPCLCVYISPHWGGRGPCQAGLFWAFLSPPLFIEEKVKRISEVG